MGQLQVASVRARQPPPRDGARGKEVRMMQGSRLWACNVFLTPDAKRGVRGIYIPTYVINVVGMSLRNQRSRYINSLEECYNFGTYVPITLLTLTHIEYQYTCQTVDLPS